MGKPRACDVCSLRKIRCDGEQPCSPCRKANFDCSYAKRPLKPGPKGPRATTSNRIRSRLQDIRAQAGDVAQTAPSAASSLSPPSPVRSSDPFDAFPRPSAAVAGPSQITFKDVQAYLKIYHHKMYAVWPVVNTEEVIARLGPGMQDEETCALAFSVCAATGAQLRLDDFGSPHSKTQHSIIDRFAYEAERCRAISNTRENANVNSILVPFFLMMYYSSRKKRITSTLLLREALTLCELLDLNKEAMYANFNLDEQRYRRKVFWLLFITERGHAMQHEMATVLRNTIALPGAQDDKDPVTFMGFLKLVHLFVAVDGTLIGEGAGDANLGFTTDWFANLQEQLSGEPQLPVNSNEVQRTDITLTQHWMRMLVWQLTMKKVKLTTGSSEDPLSLTYPAHIAKDSLAFLSGVSLDSVIAHGPGMELKIFEIANTLLDVIRCVPSLTYDGMSLMRQGPRDIFHDLSCLLGSISGAQSRSVALLQKRMAEFDEPFISIPRFVEIHDEAMSSPLSNDANSAQSPNSPEFPFGTREWQAPPTSVPYGPRRTPSDERVENSWARMAASGHAHPSSIPTPLTSLPNRMLSPYGNGVLDPPWAHQNLRQMEPDLDGLHLGSMPGAAAQQDIQVPSLGLANNIAMDWPPYGPQV